MGEEALGIDRAKVGERIFGKRRICSIIVSRSSVPVGEVTAAVSGGEKLPTDALLPFQQKNMSARNLCRGQSRDHAGCAAADDGNFRIMMIHGRYLRSR